MIDRAILIQGLIIVLGLPTIAIALGELTERYKRKKDPLYKVFEVTRNLLLPPLVLWWVLRQFFRVPEKAIAIQVISSLYWLALIYVLLLSLNTIVTSKQHRFIDIPNLLFQFLRAFVVLSILAYILAKVWQVDLSQILGALGIGSVAIAISLQDTLSNLVSGFLLIVEKPFKVGDWIKIGQLEGEVLEINWRAVRIKSLDRDVIVIPNGNLGKENICNYTLFDPLHAVRLRMPFSYKDRPDVINRILRQVAITIDGIESQPLPEVVPKILNNTHIEYEVVFFITHYSQLERIEGEFWNRAYYAIRRAGFDIPFANKLEYKLDFVPPDIGNSPDNITKVLRSLSLFSRLDNSTIEYLSQHAKVEIFGTGERIVSQGETDSAFYILLGGEAILTKSDPSGQSEIARLNEGDFLGETVFLAKESSLVWATVTSIVTAIAIAPDAILEVVRRTPQFALEISQLIDERKSIIGITEKRITSATNNF
ncbi:MAG: mechanosensitive ion channel family protein [Cyanobacteria bacterium P01_A01_bin.83]